MGKLLHPSRQQLLDVGLNVFAIDLLAESLLRKLSAEGPPGDITFFHEVNRSDCPEFKGVNITLEPVKR